MTIYLKHVPAYSIAVLTMLLVFSSCKKPVILTPDFDVTVSKTTFKVNEPVIFDFTGTADVVTFYSGVTGAEYKYKDRLTVTGKPQIQFTSFLQSTSTQTNTLSLLVSNDFSGTYDVDNIQKAKWTAITSRATLSTGIDNTPSGIIDLTDLQVPVGYVYIAFRYTAKKDAVMAQPTWTIKNIAIDNKLADGTNVSVATIANLNWGIVDVLNPANKWASSTSALTFTGGAVNLDDNEDWIISQPLQLDRVQRTFGKSIKPSPTTTLTRYIFPGFAAAGTYTMSFEALNANRWGAPEIIVKEFTITVQ